LPDPNGTNLSDSHFLIIIVLVILIHLLSTLVDYD